MSRRAIFAALVALALPAAALAARIAPPKAGPYSTREYPGGFRVSGEHISGFHMSGSYCSLGEITIAGRQPMHLITGGGYSNWVIGYADPGRKNPNDDVGGVVGERVTVETGGKSVAGRLAIVFNVSGRVGDDVADLRFANCEISFDPGRA